MEITTLIVCLGPYSTNDHYICSNKENANKQLRVAKPTFDSHPNWVAATQLSTLAGATTFVVTGGEDPALRPNEVTHFLCATKNSGFTSKVIKTKGLSLGEGFQGQKLRPGIQGNHLINWLEAGLNVIDILVVSTRDSENACFFQVADYPPLATTIAGLRNLGLDVHLSFFFVQSLLDSEKAFDETIDWCLNKGVTQVTIRPVHKNQQRKNVLNKEGGALSENGPLQKIVDHILSNSSENKSDQHPENRRVFRNMNLCLVDCLKPPTDTQRIRKLIYYSATGEVAYDWTHGATLLAGTPQHYATKSIVSP